jgi:hypothetical protein
MILKRLESCSDDCDVQGKSKEVRWRDTESDHCDYAIEIRAVSDEESKEADRE